jgi:hypothetical protein
MPIMMKKLAVPLLIIVALAVLAIWGARQQGSQQSAQPIACADPVTGCSFVHDGQPAHVRFSAQPQALKPFVLSLASPKLQKASVSFQMSGMNMGFNLYELRPGPGGRWAASVTLPVCTVNRADWIAELNLDGRLYVLAFTTR